MKYLFLAMTAFPVTALAAVDFNSAISQSYKDQAVAYRKVKKSITRRTMVADSRSRELESLGRAPAADKDFLIELKPAKTKGEKL